MREFERRMRDRFGARVESVRLFGSYARGQAHEDSDVDVIALVQDLSWAEKIEAVGIGAEVSLVFGLQLAPVVMSTKDFNRLIALESAFAEDIVREGVAV